MRRLDFHGFVAHAPSKQNFAGSLLPMHWKYCADVLYALLCPNNIPTFLLCHDTAASYAGSMGSLLLWWGGQFPFKNLGRVGPHLSKFSTTLKGLLCRVWYFSNSQRARQNAFWEVFASLVFRPGYPWNFVRVSAFSWAKTCPERIISSLLQIWLMLWNLL